jgi:hypothetical protein
VRPPLWEFVFLSMLLHALAIALFGAPSGGSREGRAMWGSLQVVLQGAAPQVVPGLTIERQLQRLPALRARPERRSRAPRVAAPPAVAAPTPAPVPAAKIEAPKVEAPKVDAPAVAADAAPKEAPFVVPPLLDRVTPAEADVERVPLPDVPIPPQTPIATPAEEARPELAAPPEPPPAAEPPAPAPPVAVEPPVVERAPAETPKIETTIPVPPPPAAPERAPVETPALPVPAPTPPTAQPPVELPAMPVPEMRSAPPVPAAPKMPVESAPELPSSAAPAPPPAVTEAPPRREPATEVEPAAPAGRAPEPVPAPTREGTESPFKRGAPPPGDYDPTRPAAPGLDLDAVRRRAGELTREGSGQRALLPFPMPPAPPKKSKMESAIENARKPDCRTAYQALGLAAAIPLIANEFGEGNCRW